MIVQRRWAVLAGAFVALAGAAAAALWLVTRPTEATALRDPFREPWGDL